MKINDYLYGEFELENVLEELINTKEIQRLHGVYQGGASFIVNKKWDVTRYEHSIGTMLLIRILGGSIEEQIAGLLHDISHTAFSHVVDYALDKSDENYHEIIFEKVVKESSIPSILKKYGFSIDNILDESKWSILEMKAPKLCADRVDYTLRDTYKHGRITKSEVDDFIKSLFVVDGEIVINSIKYSEWFVDTYYKEVVEYFMHPLNLFAYARLAEAIRICLNNGELSKDDLLKEDNQVLEVLNKSKNNSVKNISMTLNSKLTVIEDKEDYQMHKTTKLRFVDPTVIVDGRCIESSKLSSLIKDINMKLTEKVDSGVYLKRL